MIKHSLNIKLLVVLGLLFCLGLTSCSDDKSNPAHVSKIEVEMVRMDVFDLDVKVTPNAFTAGYKCGIGTKDDLNAFINNQLESIQTFNNRDQNKVTFSSLNEDTQYVVYVQGANSDGVVGEVIQLEVLTDEAIPTVVIEEVTNDSGFELTVKFVPDQYAKGFKYAIGEEQDKESFLDGTLEGIVTVESGEPKEVIFTDLVPGKEYTVFARAINKKEVASPNAQLLNVEVLLVPYVAFEFSEFNNAYATATYQANELVELYAVYLQEYSVFTAELGETAEEIKDNMLNKINDFTYYVYADQKENTINWISPFTLVGDRKPGIEPGSEMVMAMLVISEDGVDLKLERMKSPDYVENLPAPGISIETSNVTSTSADITVKPNEGTVLYYTVATSKAFYEMFTEMGLGDMLKEDLMKNGRRFIGSDSHTFHESFAGAGIQPGEDMVLLVMAWNENGSTDHTPEMLVYEFELATP